MKGAQGRSKTISRNISQTEINQKKILDYGCGTGDAACYFAEHSAQKVTAIDIGKKNIQIGNQKKNKTPEKYKNIDFICSNLNHYSITEKYDLIWSDTVIELLRKPLDQIVKNFNMALNQNGIVYLSFLKKNIFNTCFYGILKYLKIT